MLISNIDFPDAVIDALHERRLVVFAGAGVSMDKPACLPNFKSLTESIAKGTGKTQRNGETFEQFLGRLQHQGVKVHVRAKRRLVRETPEPTDLHRDLLRLYPKASPIRLVTTNFDLLFEHAVDNLLEQSPEVFRAPGLPLGNDFEGIVHVHGSVSVCQQMVLTDKDFGQAYLTEGWARRFLVDLFNNFVILFVGYRHEDTAMNYLARALPGQSEDKRFIFTGSEAEKKPEQWSSLGLKPIVFPQEDGKDYSELHAAIHELAERVQRRIVEWKPIIKAIASSAPPTDKREADFIKYALADKVNLRFFARTASNPDWIDWLDERGLLDALFKHGKLKERDRILSRWLSGQFAYHYSNRLILLIAKRDMQLHPRFWDDLAGNIGTGTESSLSPSVLSRWISLLLGTSPRERTTQHGEYVFTSNWLYGIGKRCIHFEMYQELVLIFDAMIQCRVFSKYGNHLPGFGTNENIQSRWESAPLGNFKKLNELWEDGLNPNLSQIAHPLLDCVVRRLNDLYLASCPLDEPNPRLESASEGRFSIEAHRQNIRDDAFDVLIDSARECLSHLAMREPKVAAQWCDRLARTPSQLLQRLAVYTLSKRKDLSPDEKLQWLVAHFCLHEHFLRYELFSAVRQNYRSASPECRGSLIDKILEYRVLEQDNPTSHELDAKFHFDWVQWLLKTLPTCTFANEVREDIQRQFPHLVPSPHPDQFSRIQSGNARLPSTMAVEDLVIMPLSDTLNILMSIEINVFSQAIRQDFPWSMQLADVLAADGKWDVSAWRTIIETWSGMELTLNQGRQVLGWFERTELYSNHSREITDALYTLVSNEGLLYETDILSRTNQIAQALWATLDRDLEHGWQILRLDSQVWTLVEYWLSSLTLWLKHQNPRPSRLTDEYQEAFSEIINEQSHIGSLGKSKLAADLPFLLYVDENWTTQNLLPLFNPCNVNFKTVWDGFLEKELQDSHAAEAMTTPFLKAIPAMINDATDRRVTFVKHCCRFIVNFVDDPLIDWIPNLFDPPSLEPHGPDNRSKQSPQAYRSAPEIFVEEIGGLLWRMSAHEQNELWQRWLKDYWLNRLDGVPVRMNANEAKHMIDWLVDLPDLFSDAAKLAIQMPKPRLEDTRIPAFLADNRMWESHPETVAKLLIYLSKCTTLSSHFIATNEIVDALIVSDISAELLPDLQDIQAQLPD